MEKQKLISLLKTEGTVFKLFNSDDYIVKSLGVRHNSKTNEDYIYHEHTETGAIGWLAVRTIEFAITNYKIKLHKK